jgi:membrane protein
MPSLDQVYERLPWPLAVLLRAVANFVKQEGMQWAGAVAFYLVLSVPPLVIAATSIAITVAGSEAAEDFITEQVAEFLPVAEDMLAEVAEVTVDVATPAALISLGFLLFSGTRIFAALIAAIHLMWHEVEPAGIVRTQLTRGVMLAAVGGLIVLAAALEVTIAVARDALELPVVVGWVLNAQIVPVILLTVALFTLYRLVPRRQASTLSALVVALLAAVALRVAQFGFTFFLITFAEFETAYGPLASIAAIMTWALVASVIILVGAHLVAIVNGGADVEGGPQRPGESGEEGTAPESSHEGRSEPKRGEADAS